MGNQKILRLNPNCQEDLEELRFKWGHYKNLSALENLKKIKFLYLGECRARVDDLTPITKLKNLVVLKTENFKLIEDYSPLIALSNLEQLIAGSLVKDLEFLREMPNLRSVFTTTKKEYTDKKIDELRASLPNLKILSV